MCDNISDKNISFQSLNPGRAIAEIKKLLAGIAEKGNPGLEGTSGITKASGQMNNIYVI